MDILCIGNGGPHDPTKDKERCEENFQGNKFKSRWMSAARQCLSLPTCLVFGYVCVIDILLYLNLIHVHLCVRFARNFIVTNIFALLDSIVYLLVEQK